jgi:SWI/SNF-related matrix-associated actin-dependent regulator of chromatin subfamily A3
MIRESLELHPCCRLRPHSRSNAIRVDNSAGVQIGHIPAVIAVRLSPLLDKTWIQLEGQMVHGNLAGGNPYKLNITLSIYAPEESRGQLE